MKKILVATLFLAGTMSFSSACNNSNNDENSKSAIAPTSQEKAKTIHLTTETFKQKVFNYETNKDWKYEGSVPCIIDFYASWCGPCKRIAPILEELAEEYDGKIIIYKVNTESEQELAGAFGIQSIPALLFVPVKGQPQMAQGALPKETFIEAINEVLLKE